MNDIDFYKYNINDLFINPFFKLNKNKYSWNNIKNIFDNLYLNLENSSNNQDFLKNYYIFILIFIYYTNYLKYFNDKNINNQEIYEYIHKIKNNKNINKIIIKNLKDPNIKVIFNLSNQLLNYKFKKKKINDNNINSLVENYINNNQQFTKILDMPNNTYKKILNLIICRFLLSKNNKFNNYNDFYINVICNNKIKDKLNFNDFILNLDKYKFLLNLNINNIENINYSINDVINFILNDNKDYYINNNLSSNKHIFICNKINNSIIKININTNYNNIEFNHYQSNLKLLYFNCDFLKKYNFLKKTSSLIEININSNIINDNLLLLEFIHYLIISFKIDNNSPNNIYEYLYPIEFTNYYYDTFKTYFKFNKKNNNDGYKKFILDIIKYYYIYSYYDYYFYYKNNLIELLILNNKNKNNIFLEFIQNLKKILILPNELFNYPPFINLDNDDINSIMYYNFEIPNYFKLFDLFSAYSTVFNINTISEIINDLKNYKTNNIKILPDTPLTNNINKNTSSDKNSNDDLKSNFGTEILNKLTLNEKKLINNKNTYIELNVEYDNDDCILNTEVI
jgi:hypothetical protein